ncbi:hypothetical protein L6R53_14815 [Myxococcota bacterium]|nr:hypothetical protein [Myxococcota bacterium]
MLALLLACQPPHPLPPATLPPDTLLLRQWLPLTTERSLGRQERFDQDGCWSQAPNTWLWVHDPVLAGAGAEALFLNGAWEPAPWFCLDARDRWRLEQALTSLPPAGEALAPRGAEVVVRYVARVDGQLRVGAAALGREEVDPATAELTALLGSLAAEGAWARSPEEVQARR